MGVICASANIGRPVSTLQHSVEAPGANLRICSGRAPRRRFGLDSRGFVGIFARKTEKQMPHPPRPGIRGDIPLRVATEPTALELPQPPGSGTSPPLELPGPGHQSLSAPALMHYASGPARRLAECTLKFLVRPPTADSHNGTAPASTVPAFATAPCALARARKPRSPCPLFPIFGSWSAPHPTCAPSSSPRESCPPPPRLPAAPLSPAFFSPQPGLTP